MKRSIIVANWKMYATSIADAHVLATSVRNNILGLKNIEIVLCPPAIWLTEIADIVRKGGKISLGAQNMFYEPDGAYTGEISPLMIQEVADYVIIGHSERRENFGETDMDVNEKVLAALKADLAPIICVGEKSKSASLEQPIRELKEALRNIPKKYFKEIIVCYEPVWAISSPKKQDNADPMYVAKAVNKLREIVHIDTPILYGGSVSSSNISEYAARPEIDGVMVGGASVRSGEFVKICRNWSYAKSLKLGE